MSGIQSRAMIDTRAVIDPSARIGANVQIGPFAVIGADVEIGEGCRIGPHAVINGPTRMGRDNHVFQFASIGEGPQDLSYKGEPTRLEIGDRNMFRECCTVHRGTVKDKGVTTVGSDNLFMAYTHVAHDCIVGDHCVMANYATLGGHVQVGDWVHMGGYSGIHQFCKVGPHAFLANNAAVTQDVPPYVLVTGAPAEPHSINSKGLQRRGFTEQQIRNLRNAYKVLYRSGLKLAQAEEQLKKQAETQPELKIFVDFLGRTTRSIVR